MKTVLALGLLLTGGTAMADWGDRDTQREHARFEMQRRLDRCYSEHCRRRVHREFRRDMARIDEGRYYRF
jgi:hypothetical protein